MWSRKVELEGVNGHEHEQHETSDGQIQLTALTLRWDAVLQSSPSGRQAVSPPANDKSSEPVTLTASKPIRAMGTTDNISVSSFGTVN